MKKILILSLVLLALLWPAIGLWAQEPPGAESSARTPASETTPTVYVDESLRARTPLAFPQAKVAAGLGGQLQEAAGEIDDALRNDLEESRIFALQGPAELSVLNLTGNRSHDFEQYRSLGNEVLLLVEILQEDGKLVLEGRLYDVASGQSILGKRYRGQPDQARRVAHSFADEIHRQFTGRPGIARTTIAFHSDRDEYDELYLMDYDGHDQRRITGHRSTTGFPDWSPSGDAIAYMSYFSGSPELYFVEVATGNKVHMFGEGTLNISPSFSPDGRTVAFAHSHESNVDIYLCERQCKSPRRLTDARGIDTNPVFSPSGDQIAFTSDRSGRPNVYIMDLDTRKIRRISFEGTYNDSATWRPDETHIAYTSRRKGIFQIAITELVDLTTRTLTSGNASHESPTFSPDGRRIAFALKQDRRSQIYIMDADGGNWKQLTHEGNNFSPDWSPYPAD